jgi:hypothetical protein
VKISTLADSYIVGLPFGFFECCYETENLNWEVINDCCGVGKEYANAS